MSYYKEARTRAKRVKNPWNLLQIPLGFGGIALFTWIFLQLVLSVVGHFKPQHTTLNSYQVDDVRSWIFIPLFLAAVPLGLMSANIVLWLIPFLRRIQDEEAVGHKETDFVSSMRGLIVIAKFLVPLGFALSILVALLGN